MCDENDDLTIKFKLEIAVSGTPVSFQSKTKQSKRKWKAHVKSAAEEVMGRKWLTDESLSITIYDFPSDETGGDIDNIVKLIQDSLNKTVYLDDNQIRRVVAQRFLPNEIDMMDEMPEMVARALVNDPPFVYIWINNNPLGEAQ